MEVVITKLHNFLATVFSLVDHVRRDHDHFYECHPFNEELTSELLARVLSHQHHRIAQGLRDYCLHVDLSPGSFVLSFHMASSNTQSSDSFVNNY